MGITWRTLAELELGVPCNLLGRQVSEEETLVSTAQHTDLVRQIPKTHIKIVHR